MWIRNSYKVEMVDHDYDLKAFKVIQDDEVQMIYPVSIEDMNYIIECLDSGEEVDGWEDGIGNTIVIK